MNLLRNGRMHYSLKKIGVVLLFTVGVLNGAFTADWTLAAQKFTFTQNGERTAAQQGEALLIPQLILEQMASNSTRIPTTTEIGNRTLDDLLTKRQSLFLQLVKEVKARDSLLITEPDNRSRGKKILEEDEKIKDLEKQIDENLASAEKAKKESEPVPPLAALHAGASDTTDATSEDNAVSATDTATGIDSKNINPFLQLPNFFGKKAADSAAPAVENIVLYKNDYSQLFTPTDDIVEAGMQSREYEKAVVAEKINGLITGSIIIYGEYAAVTAELYIFPGAVSAGVITEVGSLSDCVQIAKNIARYLSPKIFNSMPVSVFFDIAPAQATEKARITIDGFVYENVPDPALIQAGIHTVEIDSPGYNTQTVTWNFADVPSFLIHATLTEKKDGTLSVSLKKPFVGSVYSNGIFTGETGVGKIDAKVTVNGQAVIGQFVTDKKTVKKVKKEVTDKEGKKTTEYVDEEGSYIGSFFYIPEELSVPGQDLIIKTNPVDNASVIDKRRIWMYRGYSALIVSLPAAFYCYGTYDAQYKAYSAGAFTDVETLKQWQKATWASIGVSAVAGTFFVIELIRYLRAADAVIPMQARIAKPGEVEKSLKASEQLIEDQEQPAETESATEEASTVQNETTVAQDAAESNTTAGQTKK